MARLSLAFLPLLAPLLVMGASLPTTLEGDAGMAILARQAANTGASNGGDGSASNASQYDSFREPDYSAAGLKKLWDLVEKEKPVVEANITSIEPRPDQDEIAVPDDPRNILGLPTGFSAVDDGVGVRKGLKLPRSFKYGVASAAFQVEGAAKADGKGPSQWDFCGHAIAGCIANNDTGDVADNHYYLYKRDLARLKRMGVDTYSFSFSWPRVFPFGNGPVNEEALKHYDDVINEAIEQGLEPIGTLYHWDFPLSLEFQYGSFRDPRIIEDFERYADTILRRYGDRIKTWVTFNEPNAVCGPYLAGAPLNSTYSGPLTPQQSYFHCAHNLLTAHAKVYRHYHKLAENGTVARGTMGFKNDNTIALPHRPGNAADIRAAERHDAVLLGLWSDPVYGSGEWPKILTETFPDGILPALTDEDKKLIKGTADFYAIDLYSVRVARETRAPGGLEACERNITHPDWPQCVSSLTPDIQTVTDPSEAANWPLGELADSHVPWLYNTAGLVRNFLRQIRDRWSGDMPIYLSEVGFAEPNEK